MKYVVIGLSVLAVSLVAALAIGWWLASRRAADWQDCDHGEAYADPVDAHLDDQPLEVLLRHEAIPGYDEPDGDVEDIHQWAAELLGDDGIEKYQRRMERWSA